MSLITDEYRKLNEQMHNKQEHFGICGFMYSDDVLTISNNLNSKDILDYGCGKNTLSNSLPFAIKKYDPAIRAFHEEPAPADIVCCTDVMEHIEPELLDNVLSHIHEKTMRIAFFVISTCPAQKSLPDGRNAHICLHDAKWWFNKVSEYFLILNYAFVNENVKLICKKITVEDKNGESDNEKQQ